MNKLTKSFLLAAITLAFSLPMTGCAEDNEKEVKTKGPESKVAPNAPKSMAEYSKQSQEAGHSDFSKAYGTEYSKQNNQPAGAKKKK